jgi:hypothetical protein
MGWDGMGWDGMGGDGRGGDGMGGEGMGGEGRGWDGMGWDGRGWDVQLQWHLVLPRAVGEVGAVRTIVELLGRQVAERLHEGALRLSRVDVRVERGALVGDDGRRENGELGREGVVAHACDGAAVDFVLLVAVDRHTG